MTELLNRWSVWNDVFFFWEASVPLDHDRPGDLLDWTLEIADLGERHGVARFRQSNGDWWSLQSLREHLQHQLAQEGMVDAFHFSRTIGRVASRLAYFDGDGIAEDWVVNPGALLSTVTGATRD